MPVLTHADWDAWNEERANFSARNTEGFSQDIKTLEAHISTLLKVCPKDSAGWPTVTALNAINKLRKDLETFKHFLEYLT